MSDVERQIRCMRCGAQMEMRDPGPDRPWTPDQFWVCNNCGRHFWTTYPTPKPKVAADAGAPATSAKPAPETPVPPTTPVA